MVEPLAWSADESRDDVRMPPGWRAVFRSAIGMFAACIAVAGAITVVDWFPRRPPQASAVTQTPAPSPDPPAPVSTIPQWPRAVAEHLQPRVNPNADAIFLTGVQRTGATIFDVPAAIAGGHGVCAYLAEGHTPDQAALLAVSNNSTLTPEMASGVIYSAIAAYCPEQAR